MASASEDHSPVVPPVLVIEEELLGISSLPAEALILEVPEFELEEYVAVQEAYHAETREESDDELVSIPEAPVEREWPVLDDIDDYFDVPGPSSSTAGPSSSTAGPSSSTAEHTMEGDHELYEDYATEPCCPAKCTERIPKQVALEHRYSFQEMSKVEQDCVVLGFLQSQVRLAECAEQYDDETKRGKMRRTSSVQQVQRDPLKFQFAGLTVCQKFYCFLHSMGVHRFRNLRKHYVTEGLTTRQHGHVGKPSHHTKVTPGDIRRTVSFIQAYAEKHAIPLPGRMPKWKDYRVVKLPSSQSKARIFREFFKAAQDEQTNVVKLHTFYHIWNQYCPYITVTKPADDLCEYCSVMVNKIQRSMNTTDEEKQKAIGEAQFHLNNAAQQRKLYNAWRTLARAVNVIKIQGTDRSFAVVSFDFAEQVHYPSSSRTVGPAFFKTARKCSLFGIHNEGTGVQKNYLIDEADSVGKGANAVISLLHDYLSTLNVEVLILFADNCCGQNKNNAVMNYLQWRVSSGLNVEIRYNFMLAGHTKFSPDRNFGVLKYAYARADVDCLEDLVDCVNASSHKGFNVAVPTIMNGQRNVIWSDWTDFLKRFFRPIPRILSYHHFYFTLDGVEVREFANSEPLAIQLQLQPLNSSEALLIEDLIPEPLSAYRQWYLYESIRSLCSDPAKADRVAPLPTVPKAAKPQPEEETRAKKRSLEADAAPSSSKVKKPRKSRAKTAAVETFKPT